MAARGLTEGARVEGLGEGEGEEDHQGGKVQHVKVNLNFVFGEKRDANVVLQ